MRVPLVLLVRMLVFFSCVFLIFCIWMAVQEWNIRTACCYMYRSDKLVTRFCNRLYNFNIYGSSLRLCVPGWVYATDCYN